MSPAYASTSGVPPSLEPLIQALRSGYLIEYIEWGDFQGSKDRQTMRTSQHVTQVRKIATVSPGLSMPGVRTKNTREMTRVNEWRAVFVISLCCEETVLVSTSIVDRVVGGARPHGSRGCQEGPDCNLQWRLPTCAPARCVKFSPLSTSKQENVYAVRSLYAHALCTCNGTHRLSFHPAIQIARHY